MNLIQSKNMIINLDKVVKIVNDDRTRTIDFVFENKEHNTYMVYNNKEERDAKFNYIYEYFKKETIIKKEGK